MKHQRQKLGGVEWFLWILIILLHEDNDQNMSLKRMAQN